MTTFLGRPTITSLRALATGSGCGCGGGAPLASRVLAAQASQGAFTMSRTRAGFHASSRRALLSPLPQTVPGTVNDPAPLPKPSAAHGSYHWTFERIISAALVPLTVAPFAGGALNPITDALLVSTLVLHSHIGFQSVILDYIPPERLPKVSAFMKWALRAATLTVAAGMYEFETNDIGVTGALHRVWEA